MKRILLTLVVALASGIVQADEKGVKDMLENIHWLGHDTFRINVGGKVVYFDPYKVENPVKADLILISHDHFDHFSIGDIKKLQGDKTVVVSTAKVIGGVTGKSKALKPGDAIEMDGVKIEAVPSYNVNKEFHPKSSGNLGFVVTIDGVRIYHAGDTDFIPEMKAIKADIALLPVSGTYVMTAGEAAEAAKTIKPQFAIPMHYGSVVGSDSDAKKFKEELKGQVEVVIKPKEK